jgi:hypothetical protein
MKLTLPIATFFFSSLFLISCGGSHQPLCECTCDQMVKNGKGEVELRSDTITFSPMGQKCDDYIGVPCKSKHAPKGKITSAALEVVPAP